MSSRVGYDDREGRFLYATPAMATLFGLTPDQLIGRTWYEIGVPPEVVDSLEAMRQQVIETGSPARTRICLLVGSKVRETDIEIKPTFGEDGAIAGTVVTGYDPGDRRVSTRGASRLDRTYRILSAVDEVLVRTRDRNVILREVCRISADIGGFGMSWVGLVDPPTGEVRLIYKGGRDEGLLQTVRVTVNDEPEGRGVIGTAIRENRTCIVQDVNGNSRMDPWRYVFDQLHYRTAAGFPIRIGGQPIGALALYSTEAGHFDAAEARLFEQVVGDISNVLTALDAAGRLAEARAAVADSERRYRELFDVNPHPLAVVDSETFQFLEVNRAAIDDYGFSRDEFLSMTILDLSLPDQVAQMADAVALYRGEPGFRTTGPWSLRLKDGSEIHVEVSAHSLQFLGRRARLLLAIDVTERERLQEQMTEMARIEAMGRLASGIAHDFNNLLTAINGYSDLLMAELGGDPRAELAGEIRRAGTRATDLTRQILAFSRRLEDDPRPIDVAELVDSVSQMLRRLIGENIRLVSAGDGRKAVVVAVPSHLEQILVNLAVNSRDAMPDGGELRIEVSHLENGADFGRDGTGPFVLLSVVDNGSGMDQATLDRAFEPFFTTKAPGVGTGLGLSTVFGLVQANGGEVRIESAVGAGTTIRVLLPEAEGIAVPLGLKRPAREAPALARATILVVEDDRFVRSLAVATLEKAGHRVLVAGSPAEAIALAGGIADPIDLLLTDVVMPGSSGEALAAQLVAQRPDLKVLAMSGYDGDGERIARSLGGQFLAKPFDADSLLTAISRTLESADRAG